MPKLRQVAQSPSGQEASDSSSVISDADCSLELSEEDKREWKGWCEIESDPAFFNVMLKQFGVQGVRIREVFSLTDEMLQMLPQPVYGLIFLSKWRDESAGGQACDSDDSEHIWFANQTVDNACATLAMLNILNNAEGVELGEHLANFRDYTKSFTPELKGEALGHFQFVQQIHNSFARKMDMLNSDLWMSNQATTTEAARRSSKKKRSTDLDPVYHFNAFVPIQDVVWKLDGLEKSPQRLGNIRDSGSGWLDVVKSDFEQRMVVYDPGSAGFAVFAMVRDPLVTLRNDLAKNIQTLRSLDMSLDSQCPDWRELNIATVSNTDDFAALLLGPDESYGIIEEHLAHDLVSESGHGIGGDKMLHLRMKVAEAQTTLRQAIKQEQDSDLIDESKCHARRFDYSAIIHAWIKSLAKNKSMKEVIETI